MPSVLIRVLCGIDTVNFVKMIFFFGIAKKQINTKMTS